MDQKKTKIYQRKLVNELDKLQATASSFEKRGIHENLNDVSGELSAYDQHPADYGSQMFEREQDIGFYENLENQIGLVNDALERIESGSYGICAKCNQSIGDERLAALPYATLCIDCKEEDEVRSNLEATVQEFSFEHSFRDDADDLGFYGEDAWQSVAKFGTSNSLQDEPTDLENNEEEQEI